MTADDMMKSYAPSRLIRTEVSTLIGLMVKAPLNFELPNPQIFQSLVDRTEKLLEELHVALNAPMIASFTPERLAAKISPFTQADVLREPIFYGGESAYSFQYRDFARQRYARDDEWLKAQKGFTINEAYAVVRAVGRLQDAKMAATMQAMRKAHPSTWTWLPGLTFSRNEVAVEAGVPEVVVKAVFAAFSLPNSPTNSDFSSLGDFNLANAMPLIRAPSGEYVSLQTYALVEALYDAPYYWMIADHAYRGIASRHRGQFTEELTAERLEAVFGAEHVHRNVDLLGSKGQRIGEIDVLVEFGNRLIIVQCKSKKLTLEARKGNDLQLRSDFKSAVQDAYDQGFTCAKALLGGQVRVKASNGRNLGSFNFKEVYIVSVVSEHYPALTVQGQNFLKCERTTEIHPPLVTDVFFIDVLAEMLPSPLRFLSYINRRVNYHDRLSSINELTILGYHLKRNLWLDDEMQFVMIAEDFAVELDVAMTVRREGLPGADTPPGILTRLQNTTVARLIKGIEEAREPALLDLGFLLLTLSEDTLRGLSNGIDQITKQTRSDGQKHDVTLGFREGKSGITIHCSEEPNDVVARSLLTHCQMRKYAQKADSWFGLAVRAEDGLPKFGVNLQSPWKHNDELAHLTSGMNMLGNAKISGGRFRKAKVGRNAPCPCGSGKKHKRCCLS